LCSRALHGLSTTRAIDEGLEEFRPHRTPVPEMNANKDRREFLARVRDSRLRASFDMVSKPAGR